MSVQFNIEGMDNVLNLLQQLPAEVVSKRGGVVRKALRKGAVVIQKQAKINVGKIIAEPNLGGRDNVSTGLLQNSIVVTRGKYLGGIKGERYLVWLGSFKRTYANTKHNVRKRRAGTEYNVENPNFYGRFLEYGTVKMRPHPWLRPAFAEKRIEAINVVQRDMVAQLDKLAKKYLKGR
jgi:HK97 gp10 family phage protein